MTGSPSALKARALRLLGMREHSRAELERKLAALDPGDGELKRVLDALQARGLIDEGRVLESLLHRRSPLLGARRLHQEMQRKGLPADAIRTAMDHLQTTELQRAQQVWARRFGGSRPSGTEGDWIREARYLAARGFSSEVIRAVLRHAARAEPEGGLDVQAE